jgi:FkbM family methyltransferase
MNVKRFLNKCKRGLDVVRLNANASYSQAGEDLIVQYLFNSIGIEKPTYLDIGTNHPEICNNTYLFYLKGARGVCIEPDIAMISRIKKVRPGDVLLNIGIGIGATGKFPFYLFPAAYKGWNTFSEQEALLRSKETGVSFELALVECKSLNEIITAYFKPAPNFISIDVEGLDLEILKTLDFEKFRPEVICVETIPFAVGLSGDKMPDIAAFMYSKGYVAYADTHINTVFCRKDVLNRG